MIRSTRKTGHVSLQIAAHGAYETDIASFDGLLAEYGTWSLEKFRSEIQCLSDEEHGGGIDYSDLRSVTECLFIMAELSGMATN